MNKINILVLVVSLMAAFPAQATGWTDYLFGRDRDFRPYLQNGTQPQSTNWRSDSWQPADWAPTAADGMARLDRFVEAGILADYRHGASWRSPTLYVGPSFYHLGGRDQRRVIALFDHVYQATAHAAGTVFVKDDHTHRVVGLYTREGLQLQ